jgi:hypothetical protein
MKRLIAIGLSLLMLVGATSLNALQCGFGFFIVNNGCEVDPASPWWVVERLEKRLADSRYEIQKIEALIPKKYAPKSLIFG